jgi:mannitol-1-phosphate 5-dehydrogenase
MNTAVVIGAGSIGRGFIGQIFYKSGFSTVFIDVNAELTGQLNRRREYPLRTVSSLGVHEETVCDIAAVDAKDAEAVASSLQSAAIAATAVGVHNLVKVAEDLAAGLQKRIENGRPPVNILVCENSIDANRTLKREVAARLPEELRGSLDGSVGFVGVSVGRMVPAAKPSAEDPLLLQVEPYSELPYDMSCWRGEAVALHGGVPCEEFDYFNKRKLYVHSLGHAAAAYRGALKGYRTVHEAMADAAVSALSIAVMEESGRALDREYPLYKESTARHIEDLALRFTNRVLQDPISRVCADPLRKLGPDDRLVGAMRYCLQWEIECPHILSAIAAGLLYMDDLDKSSVEMRKRIKEQGVEHFLSSHCGIKPEETQITGPVITAYHAINGA